MRNFKDLTGREWAISLTLGNAMRVDQAGIESADGVKLKLVGGEPQEVVKMMLDDYIILQICGVLVGTQLSPEKSLQEQFYDNINQELFTDLKEALWGELSDFFPQTRILFSQLTEQHRELLKRNERLQKDAEPKLNRKLTNILDNLTTEAETSLAEAVSIEEPEKS